MIHTRTGRSFQSGVYSTSKMQDISFSKVACTHTTRLRVKTPFANMYVNEPR